MEILVKNDRICLKVSNYGAEMTSLTLDGFEFLYTPNKDFFDRVSPCLFPITGRFMDGYYTHKGIKYPMKLNGFAMEKAFKIVKIDENTIECTLTEDEDTKTVYPYDFKLVIRYKLVKNSVEITYEVTNNSDEVMPYSVGNHTAYKWPLMDGQDSGSYFLRFEQNETIDSFNPFGWTANFLNNENIRPIYHGFYENYTRSIHNPKSKWIEYTGANCDYVVRTYRENFPFIANWARPENEANLVCIEPCLSISSHGPTMFDREGIHSLEAHSTEITSYRLELYKKSEQ